MTPNPSYVGPRQAVVLIHGIGEQRPMATLRAFVEWLLPSHGKNHDYYSKPDQISGSFELRRIKLKRSSEQSLNLDWPETDFYEYYWAHQMHGTTILHVVRWLSRVTGAAWRHRRSKEVRWVFRRGCREPLIVVGLAALIALVGWVLLVMPWLGALKAASLAAAALGLVWWGVRMVGTFAVLGVVGDAARYLDVHPSNVARRYDILRHGVSMLRKFHEDHDELAGEVRYRYGRVVLVGHSLGSVIAYDIIKHYWADVNGKLRIEGRSAELLKAVAGYDPPPMAEFAPPRGHKDPDRFRQAQANAWSSINKPTSPAEILSKTGFPHPRWLVSDLVTLGSPLAYARLLLADGPADLDSKVKLRELPTCPPDRSTTANEGYYTVQLSAEAVSMEDYSIIHHAAPFALTRWTNFHLRNDPVGYCLRGVLGEGIRDISIDHGPGMFKAHTSYWPIGACDRAWRKKVRDEMLSILQEPECCRRQGRVLRC